MQSGDEKGRDIIIYVIGRIAQLEERCPYKAEVTGSSPVPPTMPQ